jgi:hypothetical protein
MKDTTPNSRRSKGQVVLVTAVLLGILFISLTAIAYEASSTADIRADGPPNYMSQSDTQIQEIAYALTSGIHSVNTDTSITDSSTRVQTTDDAIRDTLSSQRASREFSLTTVSGRQVEYTPTGETIIEGTRVAQTEPALLTASDGGESWQPISSGGQTGKLTIRATGLTRGSTTAPSDRFTVILADDDGNAYTVRTYTTGSGNTTLAYDGTECTITRSGVDRNGSVATIDYIGGKVNGLSCPEYDPPQPITSVTIENGDQAEGTFTAVARAENAQGPSVQQRSAPNASTPDPQAHHAIYAVPIEVTVTTDQTRVTRTIIVGPGRSPYGVDP